VAVTATTCLALACRRGCTHASVAATCWVCYAVPQNYGIAVGDFKAPEGLYKLTNLSIDGWDDDYTEVGKRNTVCRLWLAMNSVTPVAKVTLTWLLCALQHIC
jgi:hypothetical protein